VTDAARFNNLGDLICRDRDLQKIAVVDLGGEETPREFSFADLDNAANGVARALIDRGLQRGNRVAILSANRFEHLAAYYGTMRAGLVSVPVNFKFPRHLIQYILQDCGAKLVFCDSKRRADCPHDMPVVDFSSNGPEGFRAFVNHGPFEAVVPDPDEPAMFLYTSGSSGKPKGVILSHRSHIWVAEARLGSQDLSRHRYLIAAPLYHMNALCVSLYALASPARAIVLPEFNAIQYLQAIERFSCTWITSVPTMLAMCFAEPDEVAKTDVSSVRNVRMGSAPISPKLWSQVQTTFTNANVMNGYGTTEAGPIVFGPKAGHTVPPLAAGFPAAEVDIKLIDESGNEADQGVLWHRTPATMTGYLNVPEKTKEVLTDDGWFISGDVFRRDENGAYFFVGRDDDMFVCGGENIYPGEVEAVLVGHPEVDQACVVPVPDEIKGEKPVAFVVTSKGAALNEDDIKSFALANAPAFQHPRMVMFMESLPLAGPGKIDRKGLTARAVENWNQKEINQ